MVTQAVGESSSPCPVWPVRHAARPEAISSTTNENATPCRLAHLPLLTRLSCLALVPLLFRSQPSISSFPSSPSVKPFPSVLVSSPFVSVSPSPSSTYTSFYPPPSPSPSSSSSSRCFTTPPTSPDYRTSHSNWIAPSTTTTPQFEPVQWNSSQPPAPTYQFDLSSSPVGPSSYLPLPLPLPEDTTPRPSMTGLGFSFMDANPSMAGPISHEQPPQTLLPAVWLDSDFDDAQGEEAQWVVSDLVEPQQGCEWVPIPQMPVDMSSYWVPSAY